MPNAIYHNFDLHVTDHATAADGAQTLRVRVVNSPSGQLLAARPSALPADLGDTIQKLADQDLAPNEFKSLGDVLGTALFPPDVYAHLRVCKAHIAKFPGAVLRIRLRFDDLALAALPWEFARVDGRTFALSDDYSIVRYEQLNEPPGTLDPSMSGPMRVAAFLTNPQPEKYGQLNLEREENYLRDALDGAPGIDPQFIRNGTLEDLSDITGHSLHVFHFAGHGVFKAELGSGGEGKLILQDEDTGRAREFKAERFAARMANANARLVVLGACLTGTRDAQNPWTGIAPALVREGIPAVVAMQFSVGDKSAALFAKRLYRALLQGKSLDRAVLEARQDIADRGEDAERDWGTPVIYMRVDDDAILFAERQMQSAEPPATVDDPPPPIIAPSLKTELIRLDVAAPEKATVGKAFDVAAAVRLPTSPVLKLDDLPRTVSGGGRVFRSSDAQLVEYRVQITAADFDVQPKELTFWLEPGKDSEIQYFQLVAKREGPLTFLVQAFQADGKLAANTRVKIDVAVEVAPPGDRTTPATGGAKVDRVALRKVLLDQFSRDELKLLCFDLGIDADNIGGDTKQVFALNLITYTERHGSYEKLVQAVRTARPGSI